MDQQCHDVGLDVSLETTSICVIDDAGGIIWRGKCRSDPDTITAIVRQHAPGAVRVGLETGVGIRTSRNSPSSFSPSTSRHGMNFGVGREPKIAVPRRHRRVKTDAIDGERLLRTLMAWQRGEPLVCAMTVPPSLSEEDRSRMSR